MTIEEAFQIIVNVTGNVAGTRLDHQRIEQALAVIKAALEKKESPGGTE